MRGSRGGTEGLDPPEKSQIYRIFLCNTGPDPLKNHKKIPSQIQCGAIIGPPAKCHLNGVSLES